MDQLETEQNIVKNAEHLHSRLRNLSDKKSEKLANLAQKSNMMVHVDSNEQGNKFLQAGKIARGHDLSFTTE